MIRADDRDLPLLYDMVSSARLVRDFTADTNKSVFAADRMTVAAVAWQMTVMGRAAGRVSANMRDRIPEIGWTAMARFADRLVREYRDVKPDEVWTTARDSAATVVRVIESALPPGVEESEPKQSRDDA